MARQIAADQCTDVVHRLVDHVDVAKKRIADRSICTDWEEAGQARVAIDGDRQDVAGSDLVVGAICSGRQLANGQRQKVVLAIIGE